MKRTEPYVIYEKAKNIHVIQLLLGHKKLESSVRYRGVEVSNTLEISRTIKLKN